MSRAATVPIVIAIAAFGVFGAIVRSDDSPAVNGAASGSPVPMMKANPESRLPSRSEARERAELLHDVVRDTLRVVHHAYYREDEGLPIPAAALKDVFGEIATRRKVELRWLVVDAQAMNVDHNPRNEFEKAAVKSLLAGEASYEQADRETFRYAAVIPLTSECLKCHLPNRRSTKARKAGLIISMPIQPD